MGKLRRIKKQRKLQRQQDMPEAPIVVEPQVTVNVPESVVSESVAPVAPPKKNLFLRGASSILNKASAVRETLFGSRVATETDKEIRKQYQKIVQQAIITQEIIKDNNKLLLEKSKEDVDLANLLKEVAESDELKKIFQKTTEGQELYGRELITATEFMQRMTATLSKAGLSLEVNLPKAIGSLSSFVKDTKIDIGARRDALFGIQKAVGKLSIKTEAIEELSKLQSDRLNFTEEENKQIGRVLTQIADDIANGKIKDAKLTGTIGDLNKSLSAIALTNRELNDFLETNVEGKSVGERLKSGLGAVEGEVKRGILSSALAAAGLPGLDLVLEDAVDLFSGLGQLKDAFTGIKTLGKAGKLGGVITGAAGGLVGKAGGVLGKAGGLVGKAGGVAGGLLKGGASLFGKIALPLAAAKGLYDFYKGFEDVEGISGIAKDKATLGTKIQAGISGVFEGLTFGLVSAQDTFKFIDKGVDAVVGPDGVLSKIGNGISTLGSKIASMFDIDKISDNIMEGFKYLFGDDGILSFATKIVDKVMAFMEATPLGLLYKSVKSFFGDTPGLQPAMATASPASVSNIPQQMGTRGYDMAVEREKRNVSLQRQLVENSGKDKTVVVQAPTTNNNCGPARIQQVDDLGLAVLNSNLMDK